MRSFTRFLSLSTATLTLTAGWLVAPSEPASAQETVTVVASAAGSFRFSPELGVLEPPPAFPEYLHSRYRRVDFVRDFRRGMMEFDIPPLAGPIVQATLVIREINLITNPPTLGHHLMSFYEPADLEITSEDYDRYALTFADFQTTTSSIDTHEFDVTLIMGAVTQGTIGFRVQLADDPFLNGPDPLGRQFSGVTGILSNLPPQLVLEVDSTTARSGSTWGRVKEIYRNAVE